MCRNRAGDASPLVKRKVPYPQGGSAAGQRAQEFSFWRLGPEDIGLVRHWLATEPAWNRARLSRELCRRWDWRNGAGRLKDMACRTLLLKLERRGQIRLPARQRPSPNALRNRRALDLPCDGVELVETFVDRQRFRGACYRAAGWWHVGATTGRSRNDVDQTLRVPVKDIYPRPLSADWRRRLCAPACAAEPRDAAGRPACSLPEGRAGR